MLLTLAFRHLMVKPGRSLFLLLGYSLGVGVMIVLLSVGEAMLDQARDVSLVGGGEITVLPEGIDVEALRTGGVSGMFFTIDRARFVARQALGGPRESGLIAAVSPSLESKLIYIRKDGETVAVRAGGEIPGRARAVGAGLTVLHGRWEDDAADSAYVSPSAQQLYDEIDHFHLPEVPDSSWGEWHYFNIIAAPNEWWYVSLLVGGQVPAGKWGGQVLVTHRRPDGHYERFSEDNPATRISFDTTRANLAIGNSRVDQTEGSYRLVVQTGDISIDLTIEPRAHHYFPPVQLKEGPYPSGYAVAALRAEASGRLCSRGKCEEVRNARAYHDHNWGVWRDVTWEWGAASGHSLSFLYGEVRTPGASESQEPFFFSLVDSLGIRQVLRGREITYRGSQPTAGGEGVSAPATFEFIAGRNRDSVRVTVQVHEAVATRMGTSTLQRHFLQMRGSFVLSGMIAGQVVNERGDGFFETFTK
ncbi:MAG: hypothetical protein ABI613_06720 [Gemmatimonadota bacterium]